LTRTDHWGPEPSETGNWARRTPRPGWRHRRRKIDVEIDRSDLFVHRKEIRLLKELEVRVLDAHKISILARGDFKTEHPFIIGLSLSKKAVRRVEMDCDRRVAYRLIVLVKDRARDDVANGRWHQEQSREHSEYGEFGGPHTYRVELYFL